MEKTSTGLAANVAASLSYILGWVSALIFLLVERENRFVRLHAVQSLIVSGILTIAFVSLNYIGEAGLTIGVLLIFLTSAYLIASIIRAHQGKGIWLGRRKPETARARNLSIILAGACFIGFTALLIVNGLLGIRDTLYITTHGYVTQTTIGEREDIVPPDFWFRGQGIYWQTMVFPEKKISFRYELDNRQFSQYLADVEVSLWTADEMSRVQQRVFNVFSQPITVHPFARLQMEWLLDTAGLELGEAPPQEQPYPTKYAIVIKHGEIERKVFLFFFPLP